MFKNYSILIVDDEPLIAETIKDYLIGFGLDKIELKHSKADALQVLEETTFDLVLLDIRLKGNYDGIEIGEFLSKKESSFMYITAHSDMEMAKRMFSTNAKAYISKPIRKEELLVNVGFILNNLAAKQDHVVTIHSGTELIRLDKNEVYFIKSDSNYLEIYQQEKKIIVRNTIEGILEEINDPDFVQTHRSYLINSKKIQKISAREILLQGDIIVPLSRTFSPQLRTNLN